MSDAFYSIPAAKNTPLFVFGDHASRHIPDAYDNLGLKGDDLTRHIAWDIGTETSLRRATARLYPAIRVSQMLIAKTVLSAFTRLIMMRWGQSLIS